MLKFFLALDGFLKTLDFNLEPSFLKNPEFDGEIFLKNVTTFFIAQKHNMSIIKIIKLNVSFPRSSFLSEYVILISMLKLLIN